MHFCPSRLKRLFFYFQRCSPPALVLSLSPGLGPDGLPSPGGYFPHTAGSGSGGFAGSLGNGSASSLTLGSCLTPPLLMSGSHSSPHPSSPCNEFLAVAMRSNVTSGERLQQSDQLSIWTLACSIQTMPEPFNLDTKSSLIFFAKLDISKRDKFIVANHYKLG